jgi:YHYH protein
MQRHFGKTSAALGLLMSMALTGCGGGSSDTSSTITGTTYATAGVLCNFSGSGNQNLVYNNAPNSGTSSPVNETLPFNYNWTCSSSSRTVTGNGVPNHDVTGGNFATKLSEQPISVSMSTSPIASATITSVKLPGYALNSVKMDPATAGTCTNSATSDASGCNYAGGNGTWRMEAMADPGVSPWKFDFGTDVNNAHVQPNGQYHYHGMPTNLIPKINSASTTSMTLVGWAADGFPIYANLGYTTATSASSALKEMKGSYRVKTTPNSGRPSTSLFAMGHFQQDWEYVSGLGDLDECNGRTGVTPEFPNGIYHYYITKTYPFIQRCVKGSAASWANSAP